MASEAYENRRSDVHRLLQDCMDEKVLRGGTASAISKAEEAYRLAHLDPRLPSPWPQLAAYRLSHLIMRYQSLEAATLEKIDGLLVEAATGGHLGPLPSIYRLAVMHRQKNSVQATRKKGDIQLKIDRTIDESVEWLRRNRFSEQRIADDAKSIQAAAFNLLELAHYFLGAPYEKLEGLAGLHVRDPLRTGRWCIVGRNIAKISMTEELARCEFDSRSAMSPGVVLFTLDTNGASWGISPSKCDELKNINEEFVKLIFWSMDSRIRSSEDLRWRVVGEDGEDPDGRFRQVKRRTKKDLQELIGRGSIEIFDGYRLSESVSILGLVHESALR